MGFIPSSLLFWNFSLISSILFGINGKKNGLSGTRMKKGSLQYRFINLMLTSATT
jgi:hypothetical protein